MRLAIDRLAWRAIAELSADIAKAYFNKESGLEEQCILSLVLCLEHFCAVGRVSLCSLYGQEEPCMLLSRRP